jgi:hypothetical protein
MSRLAEAACSLGDTRRATALYELLTPYEDRVGVTYSENVTGSVARYLGLLATTLERWEAAERHFADALAINERVGARPSLAHTQHDQARMLLTRGGDLSRARELLTGCRRTYRRLGMQGWADKASVLLQRAG